MFALITCPFLVIP